MCADGFVGNFVDQRIDWLFNGLSLLPTVECTIYWIFNGFGRLPIGRCIFAREVPLGWRRQHPRAKMFRIMIIMCVCVSFKLIFLIMFCSFLLLAHICHQFFFYTKASINLLGRAVGCEEYCFASYVSCPPRFALVVGGVCAPPNSWNWDSVAWHQSDAAVAENDAKLRVALSSCRSSLSS